LFRCPLRCQFGWPLTKSTYDKVPAESRLDPHEGIRNGGIRNIEATEKSRSKNECLDGGTLKKAATRSPTRWSGNELPRWVTSEKLVKCGVFSVVKVRHRFKIDSSSFAPASGCSSAAVLRFALRRHDPGSVNPKFYCFRRHGARVRHAQSSSITSLATQRGHLPQDCRTPRLRRVR